MIHSILARTISIEAFLFLFFLFSLYLLLNIPLQNFLNKLFKKSKRISGLVEILLLLVGARILALYTEPLVSGLVERIVAIIVNSLSML